MNYAGSGLGSEPGERGTLVNPSTAFGTVLADELARCGLREVVIAPGSRSTPLALAFDELDRAGRVRLHVRIDERSASFTALGLAKASGRPAAVVCTSGTAAANLHPAVIEADESAVPLLLLTADRPPELRGAGASQTVDQVKLYGSAVRWYAETGVPERLPGMAGYWRSLACRAWAHAAGALGTLPGPVHLNIPLRDPLVPDAPRPAVPGASLATPHPGPGSAGSSSGIAPGPDVSGCVTNDWPDSLAGRADGGPWTRVAAAAVMAEPLELPWTERGIVVCGDGDYDAAALVELAELAGWPVLAEPSSGARCGPNALTGYQYLLASPEFMAAHRPDVIISAGRPGLSRAQSGLLRLGRDAGPPVRQVVVAQGPGMWADPQRAATDVATAVRVTGAPGADAPAVGGDGSSGGEGRAGMDRAVRVDGTAVAASVDGPAGAEVASRTGGATGGGWLAQWRQADAAATRAAEEVLDAWHESDVAALAGQPLSEPEVARELVAALPVAAMLWCGNSLSVRDIDLLLPPRADTRVIASRGASGIDGTFSTAAGAALAHAADHPGAVTFALIGDLSLLHDAPGLAIGPGEPRPDLCVVVVNNDGGGIFEGLEPVRFGGGVSGRLLPDGPRPDAAGSAGTRSGGSLSEPYSGGPSSEASADGSLGEAGTGGSVGEPGASGSLSEAGTGGSLGEAGAGEPAALTVFERTFGTPHGASIEQLAGAFGIPYTLASRPGDVAKAVAAAVSGTGPRIVEARTGRAANADLRARMSAAAIRAVAAATG